MPGTASRCHNKQCAAQGSCRIPPREELAQALDQDDLGPARLSHAGGWTGRSPRQADINRPRCQIQGLEAGPRCWAEAGCLKSPASTSSQGARRLFKVGSRSHQVKLLEDVGQETKQPGPATRNQDGAQDPGRKRAHIGVSRRLDARHGAAPEGTGQSASRGPRPGRRLSNGCLGTPPRGGQHGNQIQSIRQSIPT